MAYRNCSFVRWCKRVDAIYSCTAIYNSLAASGLQDT
jgi:hypothetical protein